GTMTQLTSGDPAPWFTAAASNNPEFSFSSAGGRYIVLSFFGSATMPAAARFLELVDAQHAVFDDANHAFFGVSNDAGDHKRVKPRPVGIRFFWDADRKVTALYGVVPS